MASPKKKPAPGRKQALKSYMTVGEEYIGQVDDRTVRYTVKAVHAVDPEENMEVVETNKGKFLLVSDASGDPLPEVFESKEELLDYLVKEPISSLTLIEQLGGDLQQLLPEI